MPSHQGGEFAIVLMPFTFGHYGMLNRNLLYTAITRAKKALVIVGEKKAISNNNSYNRATSLDEKLIQLIKQVKIQAYPQNWTYDVSII